ncbi:hypothetical protein [Undibacterium sp. TJN19]|uniref:hypothetical protein n=1 Tax=Undibacterium sp. TJN19 TaxID=3413055 RepID=UPI003BEFE707
MHLSTDKQPYPISPFAFVASVACFVTLYQQFYFGVLVIVVIGLFCLGCYTSYRAAVFCKGGHASPWLLVAVVASWLLWPLLSASSLSVYADLLLCKYHYDSEVVSVTQKTPGNCVQQSSCFSDEADPPYVYFEYALHVPFSAHEGILYVPGGGSPQQARLDKISTSMQCESKPVLKLLGHYYACLTTGYAG